MPNLEEIREKARELKNKIILYLMFAKSKLDLDVKAHREEISKIDDVIAELRGEIKNGEK